MSPANAAVTLHPDRLLPPDPVVRPIARRLYGAVRELPILSPHGHVDARVLRDDQPFADPTSLLIQPDHYVTRLLHAGGVSPAALGVGEEAAVSADHGHADAVAAPLDPADAARIYTRALAGQVTTAEATAFRRHMMLEMARCPSRTAS